MPFISQLSLKIFAATLFITAYAFSTAHAHDGDHDDHGEHADHAGHDHGDHAGHDHAGGDKKAHAKHAEHGGKIHFKPKARRAPTNPSARHSGNSPIDMSHGVLWNNGTFGQPNPEIAMKGASSTWAVSLAEIDYAYENKARFIGSLGERLDFYDVAMKEWNKTSEITKPEVAEYSKNAAGELGPRLEKARQAWKQAKSANAKSWAEASHNAKRAFVELQTAYYQLHKNVRR
jgi:hypothetical protein